ncbi:unnamed protein product, partial [Laminaria digitata]
MTLEEWYENRILHHLIGFLVEDGVPIGDLLAKGAKLPKAEFQDHLKKLIYNRLIDSGAFPDSDSDAFRKTIKELVVDLNYDDDRKTIKAILLLFNIASLLLNADSSPMFPFDLYKKGSWDLEHVHSVSSDMPTEKNRAIEWLEHFVEHIGTTGENEDLCEKAKAVV